MAVTADVSSSGDSVLTLPSWLASACFALGRLPFGDLPSGAATPCTCIGVLDPPGVGDALAAAVRAAA